MTPEHYKNFFATIDNQARSLVETFHATVARLAQSAHEEGTLATYITSLLQQHSFTCLHVDN